MGTRRIGYLAGLVLVVVGAIYVARHYRPSPSNPPPAACQPVATDPIACSTIDGFPIGLHIADCSAVPPACGLGEHTALDGFGVRDPGHPPVVHTLVYDYDMARVCGPVWCGGSSSSVYVFELADGTRHAIGVSCPGIAMGGGTTCRPSPHYGATGP